MKINQNTIIGAIFDVDGTLLDSMPMWEKIGELYLLEQNITPKENLAETFKKMSLEESAVYYQNIFHIKKSEEEIIRGVNALIAREYREKLLLKEGVKDILTLFKENGIRMAIASATDRELIELALKRTGTAEFFQKIVTCSQVGKSKAYPNIYLEAKERLGTQINNTVIFEDALHAIQTVAKAGFPVVGVYDASEDEKKVRKASTIYIKSWKEMRKYCEV